jgi:hypothetical protein
MNVIRRGLMNWGPDGRGYLIGWASEVLPLHIIPFVLQFIDGL